MLKSHALQGPYAALGEMEHSIDALYATNLC